MNCEQTWEAIDVVNVGFEADWAYSHTARKSMNLNVLYIEHDDIGFWENVKFGRQDAFKLQKNLNSEYTWEVMDVVNVGFEADWA